MTKLTLRILLGALLLCAASLNASAQIQAGAIKAVRIEGDVQKLLADGTQVVVTEGELITEKDTLVTGANSSVVLVFMNGSTVQVGATTRMSIDEFKMDPFAEDIEPGKLESEPTVSRTSLNIAYGEVVGNVKKLSKGSAYNVRTPVGAAGIRGTTFRIALVPVIINGQNTFTITLSTSAGLVLFTAVAPEGVTPTAVEVGAGTEVQAEVVLTTSVNAAGATVVTATATVAPTTVISPAATATINAVAAFVQAAVQAVVITPVEAVAASTTAATKTETPASTPSTTPAPAGGTPTATTTTTSTTTTPVAEAVATEAVKTAVAAPPPPPAAQPITPPDIRSVSAPPGG